MAHRQQLLRPQTLACGLAAAEWQHQPSGDANRRRRDRVEARTRGRSPLPPPARDGGTAATRRWRTWWCSFRCRQAPTTRKQQLPPLTVPAFLVRHLDSFWGPGEGLTAVRSRQREG